jgi:hypothetical protein
MTLAGIHAHPYRKCQNQNSQNFRICRMPINFS